MRDVPRGAQRTARARGGPGEAVAVLHLPRVLPAVHPRGGGRRPVPGRPGGRVSRPRPAAHRRGLERAADPSGHGLLLLQLGAGPRGGRISQPGRGDRVRTGPGGLGPAGRRLPAARGAGPRRRGHPGEPCWPRGERSPPDPPCCSSPGGPIPPDPPGISNPPGPGPGKLRGIPDPGRRVLLAGRGAADEMAGLRRRRRSPRGSRDLPGWLAAARGAAERQRGMPGPLEPELGERSTWPT